MIANLVLIHALASRTGVSIIGAVPRSFRDFAPALIGYTAIGVILRGVVAAYRRELPAYLRVVRSAGWLTDTLRLIVSGTLLMHVYFWIKLLVPLLNRRMFDQDLWDLEQRVLGGFSPNILFIEMFSQPATLRVIDWSYANIFFASTLIAMAYFLSEPSRRIRVAFANGYALMWIAGAWLYMLVPSVGPAYRFPDIWMPYGDSLQMTQRFQALLMRNYRNVLTAASGETRGGTSIVLGIGAFPSLHVAAQMYVFLWMRRLWTSGEVLFGIFVVVIFLGSMITGWHYFIDGVAGAALALGCYVLFDRLERRRP